MGGVTRGNGQVYQVRLVDDSPTTTSQRSCALGGSSRVGLPRMTSAAASAMANSGLVKPGSMIWRQDIGTTHEIDVWSNVSGAWAWKRLQTYIP